MLYAYCIHGCTDSEPFQQKPYFTKEYKLKPSLKAFFVLKNEILRSKKCYVKMSALFYVLSCFHIYLKRRESMQGAKAYYP